MVFEYVSDLAEKQINSMLKKMDISNAVSSMVHSEGLKTITD